MNKSALRKLAADLRADVGLDAYEVFDPYLLAQLHGVDVIRISELDCSEQALRHFQVLRTEAFSGALVPVGEGGAVILENDSHSSERRLSTASHELAHFFLEHPFAAELTDGNKCRLLNREHEAEAAELGGELLLTADAALRLARRGATDEEAAFDYGVSVKLASWRLNATGARKRAQRQFSKRRNLA